MVVRVARPRFLEDGAEERPAETKHSAQNDEKNGIGDGADNDGQERLTIVEVQPLAYGDETGNEGPDEADDGADTGDDAQYLWCVGKANHAQHLVQCGLSAEQRS